jgi:hypothetical protein
LYTCYNLSNSTGDHSVFAALDAGKLIVFMGQIIADYEE